MSRPAGNPKRLIREQKLQLLQARCALDRAEIQLAVQGVQRDVGQFKQRIARPVGVLGLLGKAIGMVRGRRGASGLAAALPGLPWWAIPVGTTVVRGLSRRGPLGWALLSAGAAGLAIWLKSNKAKPGR